MLFRSSDDGDANPRARKRHTRHSPTSAPRQEEGEAKILYVFSVGESPWRTTLSQRLIADTSKSINEPSDEYDFEYIGGTSIQMKLQGPSAFHQRPANYFFARMWRPLAVCHQILSIVTSCASSFLHSYIALIISSCRSKHNAN